MRPILTLSFAILFSISFTFQIRSQVIVRPNAGLKSPQTLEINKIETSMINTVVYFTIENQIDGGYFCADKNINIVYPDGSKAKLVSASGIPQCPDTYKFRSIGEKLTFTLTFPPLKQSFEWIDIIEECSENCFYFYGVTLNRDLNEKLDEAFILASKQDPAKNIELFRNLLEKVENQYHGIKGLLYVNIISAAIEAGDKIEASVWYKRLLSSKSPRVNQYIQYLNEKGIRF
jgi:hypothetical protein